jgi:hypothetical protein
MPYFRDDNDDHRQFADAYCNGNCDNLPREQVVRGFQDYVQNAPRQEVQEVEREYFQQMPQAQRVGLFDNLLGMVGTDRARDQAGVTTTDPRHASPSDLSRLFGFAMNSGLLNGLLGGGQSRSQGGLGSLFGGGQAAPQQQPQGGLGGLIGGLLGGDDNRNRQQPQTDPRYSYQSQPQTGGRGGDIMSFLSNPLVTGAISGLMGYAANRFLNNRNQPQQQQPRMDAPQQSLGDNNSLQGGRSEII